MKRRKSWTFGLGAVCLLAGAASAAWLVSSGTVRMDWLRRAPDPIALADWNAPEFVPIRPLTVSLGPDAQARHLRVSLHLEVAPGTGQAVASAEPRILDVLNTFLRAVDERDFSLPPAMPRLRAQMLHRVQLVAPPGAVRDLLIQEFVLS